MGINRNFISVLLLGVFFLAKISSLHTFTHDDTGPDTIENCSWCHLAVTGQHTDFLLPEATAIERVEAVQHFQNSTFQRDTTYFPAPYSSNLFSRPPPAVSPLQLT